MRSPCILFREMIKRQKPMTSSVLMYFTAAYINEIPPPKKKTGWPVPTVLPQNGNFKGIKPNPQKLLYYAVPCSIFPQLCGYGNMILSISMIACRTCFIFQE